MRSRTHPTAHARDRGFTLIELLVVIIIIGILAAVAVPTFLNQRKKAHVAAIKADLRHAATAIEADYVPGSGYPSGVPASAKVSAGVVLTRSGMSADDANFMAFLPVCQAALSRCQYNTNIYMPGSLWLMYGPGGATNTDIMAGQNVPASALTAAGWTGPPVRVPSAPPTATADPNSYCIQGHHSSNPTGIWKFQSNGGLSQGACP